MTSVLTIFLVVLLVHKARSGGLYDRDGVRVEIKQPYYFITEYDLPNVRADLEKSSTKVNAILNDPFNALGDGLTGVDQVAKPIKHLLRYRLQGNDEAIEQLSTNVATGLLEIEEAILNSTVHLDDDDKLKEKAHIRVRDFANEWRRLWTYYDTVAFYKTICTTRPYRSLLQLSTLAADSDKIEELSAGNIKEFKDLMSLCTYAFAIPAETCALLNGLNISDMIDERIREIHDEIDTLSS